MKIPPLSPPVTVQNLFNWAMSLVRTLENLLPDGAIATTADVAAAVPVTTTADAFAGRVYVPLGKAVGTPLTPMTDGSGHAIYVPFEAHP